MMDLNISRTLPPTTCPNFATHCVIFNIFFPRFRSKARTTNPGKDLTSRVDIPINSKTTSKSHKPTSLSYATTQSINDLSTHNHDHALSQHPNPMSSKLNPHFNPSSIRTSTSST